MPTKDKRLIIPMYRPSKVRRAGNNVKKALKNNNRISQDDEIIIENWRASHNHILNTWLVILLSRIKRSGIKGIVGQRLKRKNTIYNKLLRIDTMCLDRMHDIAGCRIIFNNEIDLEKFRDDLVKKARFNHELIASQHKNYIKFPKSSGYRGVHDVFKYKSDYRRPPHWNGLLIEIQYRTKYQHAWATAVEIADVIKNSRSKFSAKEYAKQNQFFKYASEIIARAHENRFSCCPEMSNAELIIAFTTLEEDLHLLHTLKEIKNKQEDILDNKKKNLVIMSSFDLFHVNIPKVEIFPFSTTTQAARKYFELEKQFPNNDIVLVRGDEIADISNIFRNYFSNARDFVAYMKSGIRLLS